MKNLILTAALLLYSSLVFCQTHEISLNDIRNPSIPTGQALELTVATVSNPGFKCELLITNASSSTDLDNLKFFKNTTPLPKINFNYDDDKKEFSLELTPTIRIEEPLSKIVIKRDGVELYTFDIVIKVGRGQSVADSSKIEKTQTEIQEFLQVEFEKTILPNYKKKLGLKVRDGAYIDNSNTIHLFVDNYNKFYGRGIPTVATEKNSFQIHILTTEKTIKKYNYRFKFTGDYKPSFNIDDTKNGSVTPNDSGGSTEIDVVKILDGPVKGPYTVSFAFTIYIAEVGQSEKLLTNATINVAKLYHVSISTGLLATTLRNPQNIEQKVLKDGNTTLVADDPNTRGVLTIMATFYPKGRSFLFPPSGNIFDPSRFGIQIGAQLDDKISENFFGGVSFDFARGGSLSFGAHYGRRNFIAGKDNFDFGKDIFDLDEFVVKKEWKVGFYFGVIIDSKVAFNLLKSLGSTNN